MRMIITINMSQIMQLKSVYEHIVSMYMLDCKNKAMIDRKNSILLSDVSIKGDLIEKEKVIVDSRITGDITAEEVITHGSSNINGNVKAKKILIGGKVRGNLNSEKIKLTKSADVDGVLNQKTLSIEDGAVLKIKTETYK